MGKAKGVKGLNAFKKEAEISAFGGGAPFSAAIVSVGKSGSTVLTTIPSDGAGFAFFSPGERAEIMFSQKGETVVLEALFKRMSGGLCLFSVERAETLENGRKESRKRVSRQALCAQKEKSGIARITDISDSGMRIQADWLPEGGDMEIYYDEGGKPRAASGKVVWASGSKEGGYAFGVKLGF